MFEAIARGEIKALWVMGTNPAVSLPNADAAREALKKLELFVVSENVISNDTVDAGAHVLLPAQAWGEKSGTVTNSERRISRQRAFLSSPGEARPDWWIIGEVAKRLGFGAAFDFTSAADIFREHAALSAFENDGSRDFDIGALQSLSDERFRRDGAGAMADPAGCAAAGALLRRRRILRQRSQGPLHRAGNSGAADRDHGRAAAAAEHRPHPGSMAHHDPHRDEPAARPASAGAVRRGSSRRCRAARRRRRRLCAGHHRLRAMHACGSSSASASSAACCSRRSTGARPTRPARASVRWWRLTPIRSPASPRTRRRRHRSRLTNMCSAALRCRASRSRCRTHAWWARVAVNGGYGYLLADNADLAGWQSWLEIDRARRSRRIQGFRRRRLSRGVLCGDRIETCLFIGPARDAGDWNVVKGLFAADTLSNDQRRMLLSGKSADGLANAGPIVCACFGVGRNTICDTIAAGARSAADIGAKLKAGTNCGSCIPELKRLIAQTAPTMPCRSKLAVRRIRSTSQRHCEERSDEAIHTSFVAGWIASLRSQ